MNICYLVSKLDQSLTKELGTNTKMNRQSYPNSRKWMGASTMHQHSRAGVEDTLKSIADLNLLMTSMLAPEYSLTCRLLIKSGSIETFSTKPILLDHVVIHTSIGRNPIWSPIYIDWGITVICASFQPMYVALTNWY